MSTGYFKKQGEELVELTAEEAAPYIAGTKRHRVASGHRIVFTEAEEAARDAEDADWASGADARAQAASRAATDENERQAAKLDAQILADINMTPADVATTIDTVFASWTAPQRTFMKRLVRIVLLAARRVLRNG